MSASMESPDIGIFFGRPIRSQILVEKLQQQGFRVTLYNNRGQPGTYVAIPYGVVSALSHLLATHHQVYLTSMDYLPSICLYLNRLVRGYPYVYNAVGVSSAEYRDRARRWPLPSLAERWLYPALTDRVLGGASRIVCNSRYLQTVLASEFPHYAHKMITIYNGIEFERFASGRVGAGNGRAVDAPRLLAVMTWNYAGKASGAKLLIDAMGVILKHYPTARLTIAAKVQRQFHAQSIQRYLDQRPWKDSIQILYNQANIPHLLAGSNLFVYATPPITSDSLPRALLEAHAAGLPIVATATAGCPEVVEDGQTGFLVPYDATVLAHRVLELLADLRKCQAMGRAGQARVRELFNWDRMADGYAKLFREVVSERRHVRSVAKLTRVGREGL
jgi:glycosyltransferase involved in cell wall biosynthesis